MCRDITQQLRDRAGTKTQGCLVLSCSLLSERGVMKTSHPSIQGTFGSYFHWCHILEAASSHIILPSQPQMLQCVYSFLELGGGAGDPKQTDRSFSINTHLVKTPPQSLLSVAFINAVHRSLIHHHLLETYLFFKEEKLEKSFENSWVVHSSRL